MGEKDLVDIRSKSRLHRWPALIALGAIAAILFVVPVLAMIRFREEILQAEAYGYLGVFVVGLLCGISIIPSPSQLLIFTFGSVLKNPLYVGLIAGFGSGVGGLTVYLTGAGIQNVVTRLRIDTTAIRNKLGIEDGPTYKTPTFWAKAISWYNRATQWVSGKGGTWALFITSAMVFSPFYPAALAAGSLKMGVGKFFLISWAGKTVRYLYVAAAGYWGLNFILKWFGN
jgi:membrane protein YqaA with SNARE-associated domain